MPTPSGQITVSGSPAPRAPATFQVTAAGYPTQTQVGLVPSMSSQAFYQQVPVNTLPQGSIAGNILTFGGLTLAPNMPGWTLVSGQGGPGFVGGVWESSIGTQSAVGGATTKGGFRRSGSGGGGGSGELVEIDSSQMRMSGLHLSSAGWVILGFLVTLFLTDKGK